MNTKTNGQNQISNLLFSIRKAADRWMKAMMEDMAIVVSVGLRV